MRISSGSEPSLCFSSCPTIYLLPTHLSVSQVKDLTKALRLHGALLVESVHDAGLVLTSTRSERRIEAECHRLVAISRLAKPIAQHSPERSSRRKRIRLSDENSDNVLPSIEASDDSDGPSAMVKASSVALVQLQWAKDCLEAKQLLPVEGYILRPSIFEASEDDVKHTQDTIKSEGSVSTISDSGRSTDEEIETQSSQRLAQPSQPHVVPLEDLVLEKAERLKEQVMREGAPVGPMKSQKSRFGWQQRQHPQFVYQPRQVLRRSTESFEEEESLPTPEPPAWIKEHKIYACERSTPRDGPNKHFIAQLEKIKEARLLIGDEIGVRAYATSIAAIAAYPYSIHSAKEISSLPGCEFKLVQLFIRWKKTGKLAEAEDHDEDEVLRTLKTFYDIWGIGATTARDFYFNKGWRELDDVVEYGWNTLTRVQQIGLKYYDDFLIKVPRDEVARIGAIVHEHANRVRPGAQSVICGGYRRGNLESGDIDILVSHRDEEKTLNMIRDIVQSLEDSGEVTHVLKLALTNSKRSQQPVAMRQMKDGINHGFDTMDKALLVWKSAEDDGTPRRRLDIIISPWRTVGCALLGWSGGNTFQRDVRRFAKHKKNWRFDSSGVRDRSTGQFVPLEGPDGVSGDMIDAEKTVFAGLGLEYREPWERCTG